MMTKIETISLEDLEEKAFKSLLIVLQSENIKKIEFINTTNTKVNDMVEVYIGESDKNDGHIVVSTFGAGGSPTETTVDVDNVKKGYRTEFFSIAKNLVEANLLAKRLAKLAFIVDSHKEGFIPGSIVSKLNEDKELPYTLISDKPIGLFFEHKIEPIFTTQFGLFWVAVTPVTENEANLIATEKGLKEFEVFATKQGTNFYASDRDVFN